MTDERERLGPAPNIPECTCDRDDDSWVGEGVPMPLCPYHEKRLRHLSWESLACMVIDFDAALAHDRPSGSALSGSSAPEASKALTDAIHEIAQCHEALEYAAGFMADPEGLMHRREAWLAKVNAVLAARLRPSASDDAEVTEAKPETPAHSPWRHMTPSEWDAAGRPPKPEIPA